MGTAQLGRPVGSGKTARRPASRPEADAAPGDCVVVAGFPSSGKSAVLRWLGRRALGSSRRPAVAALECFPSEPRPAWTTAGPRAVPWRRWTSGDACPDHVLALRLPEMRDWAAHERADLLLVESAGLCCRCSPYPSRGVALFAADASAGRGALAKVGPMLTTCDLCVLTRPDRVTPAEREMLLAAARDLGRTAALTLDGLTGEGAEALWKRTTALLGRPGKDGLRAAPPQFYCSYCLGRQRVGILDL